MMKSTPGLFRSWTDLGLTTAIVVLLWVLFLLLPWTVRAGDADSTRTFYWGNRPITAAELRTDTIDSVWFWNDPCAISYVTVRRNIDTLRICSDKGADTVVMVIDSVFQYPNPHIYMSVKVDTTWTRPDGRP